MKRNTRYILLIALLSAMTLGLNAQMTVNNEQTVQWYVENVLLGQGVSADNITFNGQPADEVSLQCGYFASNGSYMDLESGMVLSTGGLTDVNFDGDSVIVGEVTTIFLDDGVGGDPDLEELSNEDINDHAVLEFDFVPTGDTLRFNYVFGSEEYPEFVNSFNDAFGFFLAGPGITGSFSSPAGFPDGSRNIAVIPGGTVPVTIDNVNNGEGDCFDGGPTGPCTNCEYYIDNCDIEDDALDGQTTVLEAFALVECGETYHIKIAIGDALDGSFDSAVFLEEGSFSSDLVVSASLFSSIGPEVQGVLYENCGYGIVEFTRQGGFDVESLVEIEVTGVAENGVDFTPIPSSFTFPAGDSLYILEIYAILDGLTEGLEEATVTINNTVLTGCATGTVTSEFTFVVADDPEPLQISTVNHDIDCGESVNITVDVTGGYGQYQFDWSNGSEEQTHLVQPGVTTEYFITVSDTCNAGTQSESVIVTVPVYPPLEVDLPESLSLTCLEVTELSPLLVTGGNGVYTYNWEESDGTPIGGNYANVTYVGSSTDIVSLEVIDGCFITAEDDMLIEVPVIPIILNTTSDTTLCIGEPATIGVSVSGGEPPYSLAWSHYGATQDSILVSPVETTVYEVQVTDLCQNTEAAEVQVNVSETLASFILTESGYYGVELENFSTGFNNDTLFYFWDLGDGFVSSDEHVQHDYYDLNDHLIVLTVSNEHGCTDSLAKPISGPPSVFIPNSFSPNNDGKNDVFRISGEGFKEYHLVIYDRWGTRIFETNDPEQAWNGQGQFNAEHFAGNSNYVYHLKARMSDGEVLERKGNLTLIR